MVSSRPILFLDVDGVLNCFGRRPSGADELRSAGGVTYVPVGMRERIERLLRYFEPVWATAWRGAAHGHHRDLLALSRESWPYVDYLDCKLPEIVKYAKGRRWAWVDDDAEFEYRKLGDAWRDLPGSLVVVPDPAVGLNDEHVDRLVAFAMEPRS